MIWWQYRQRWKEPWQRQLWPGSLWWACWALGIWPGTWSALTRWKMRPNRLLSTGLLFHNLLTSFSSWRTIRDSTTSATTALTSKHRHWTNWLQMEWSWRTITSNPSAPLHAVNSSLAGKQIFSSLYDPHSHYMVDVIYVWNKYLADLLLTSLQYFSSLQ